MAAAQLLRNGQGIACTGTAMEAEYWCGTEALMDSSSDDGCGDVRASCAMGWRAEWSVETQYETQK